MTSDASRRSFTSTGQLIKLFLSDAEFRNTKERLENLNYYSGREYLDFIVTRYEVASRKINTPFTCVLISDLHNKCYGEDNGTILDRVREESPDIILCAGDLIVGQPDSPFKTAVKLAKGLTLIAPVYFANGNHETEYRRYAKPKYAAFVSKMRHAGVHVLNNRSQDTEICGNKIRVTGLEVSLEKYIKFRKPDCSLEYLEHKIGPCTSENDPYTILIAHNPEFLDVYRQWKADLTVSGHYHGGVVRDPFFGRALLSPYGYVFPKFGVGKRTLSDEHFIIASAGLGDHTIPLRIFNPREIVTIKVKPLTDDNRTEA